MYNFDMSMNNPFGVSSPTIAIILPLHIFMALRKRLPASQPQIQVVIPVETIRRWPRFPCYTHHLCVTQIEPHPEERLYLSPIACVDHVGQDHATASDLIVRQ